MKSTVSQLFWFWTIFFCRSCFFFLLCNRLSLFVDIWISNWPSPHSPLVFAFSASLLSSHLDFLCLLTFWLCQAPRLYPPVSCLIIEVSVCLRGAPQYLLIKASVCVCLFICGCYSRRSPGALMRHKPPLPTEAYTVSCHWTSSHSKHCQNEILSLSTFVALEGCTLCCLSISLYILRIYIYIFSYLFVLIPPICLATSVVERTPE